MKRPLPSASNANLNEPPAGGSSDSSGGLEVGLSLVVAVLGLGAAGFGLDKWLGTLPWLMLTGGAAGFIGWMVMMARRPRG